VVLGRPWQPHESHLPYLLQLKIDFNLAGMGWLRLSHARFR
jgi:DNA polymerase zeta